jgi:ketosteroid isomerase-like protein
MDPLDRLVAIEEIKQLMARRTRCVDEKDWVGLTACFAENAISYSVQKDGVQGAKNIVERIRQALDHRTTVHQLHVPEIEIVSEERATGIWPMQDDLTWEADGKRHWQRGFGHYRQAYSKVQGRWLIETHRLSYIKFELTTTGSLNTETAGRG